MTLPRRRYIVAGLIFVAAGADLYIAGGATWKTVALIAVAAVTLVGAHAFDGVTAGPISVDTEGEEDTGGAD